MARLITPLTDTKIRSAQPWAKPYRLHDGRRLVLEVAVSGTKAWRFRYTDPAGKETLLTLGLYPELSLAQARAKREDLFALMEQGTDLRLWAKQQKQAKAAKAAGVAVLEEQTFRFIAEEWFANKKLPVAAPSHAKSITDRLKANIYPWLGERSLAEITAPELLAVLRKVEHRGALEVAHRLLGMCGEVFRYAIATGRAERNIAADLQGALKTRTVKNHAAFARPDQQGELGELLRTIEGYQGANGLVGAALMLVALTAARSGEVRGARWAEIDLDKAEWRIPAERMKQRKEHWVPLSRQAVALLRQVQQVSGYGPLVFPSFNQAERLTRPMSDMAMLQALRRMGYTKEQATVHGFRASFTTLAQEVLGEDFSHIDRQLAHAVPDANGTAYNRTEFLNKRRELMQHWADYLDELKKELRP